MSPVDLDDLGKIRRIRRRCIWAYLRTYGRKIIFLYVLFKKKPCKKYCVFRKPVGGPLSIDPYWKIFYP